MLRVVEHIDKEVQVQEQRAINKHIFFYLIFFKGCPIVLLVYHKIERLGKTVFPLIWFYVDTHLNLHVFLAVIIPTIRNSCQLSLST